MLDNISTSVEIGAEVLLKVLASTYNSLQRERKKSDLFKQNTKSYVKGMIEQLGQVKVLGQRKPTALLSLYVRANIIEKISSRIGRRMQELEADFDFDNRQYYKNLETVDGEEIANKLDKFIILGKPGAGKTTFLRYIALAMLKEQSVIERRRLPIFVTLREWADKKIGLMDFIAKQFSICGFEEASQFIENILEQGNCIVLFDGLDEVSQESNLDEIIKEIRDFTTKYGDNQFVISCRVAAYNHWFEQFTDVEMADFNQEQIATFVKNWCNYSGMQ